MFDRVQDYQLFFLTKVHQFCNPSKFKEICRNLFGKTLSNGQVIEMYEACGDRRITVIINARKIYDHPIYMIRYSELMNIPIEEFVDNLTIGERVRLAQNIDEIVKNKQTLSLVETVKHEAKIGAIRKSQCRKIFKEKCGVEPDNTDLLLYEKVIG